MTATPTTPVSMMAVEDPLPLPRLGPGPSGLGRDKLAGLFFLNFDVLLPCCHSGKES